MPFVNETIKQLIAKNKINDDFKIVEQTRITTPPLVDDKKLDKNTNNGYLKKERQKCGPEEVFKLNKDS